MNNKLTPVLIFLMAGLISCGMRKVQLGNKISDVPKNTKVYKNRDRFDSSALKYIDTSVVYEEVGYLHMDSLWLRKEQYQHHYIYYNVLRFYSNGFMNVFIIDSTKLLAPKEFDPTYNGLRGVYYRKGDKIKSELFCAVNGLQHMGKLNFYYTVKGDTLIESRGKSQNTRHVYVKRKLPPEYLMNTDPDFSKPASTPN